MSGTESLQAHPKLPPIRFQPLLPQPAHPGRSLLAWGFPAAILEGVVAVGVIWISAQNVFVEPEPTETIHYVELTPDVSLPEPPPPPEAPTLVPATAPAPPEVKGFQELAMPMTTLAEIPPPVFSGVTFSAADFTGEGRAGGFGGVDQVEDEVPPVDAGPTFTPYTVAPWLKNTREVARALEREYPGPLRSAGIGGTSLLWLFIDATGNVQQTVLKTSSGFESFDAAAMRVAMLMDFSPALNRDRNVPVWVAIPVEFKVS